MIMPDQLPSIVRFLIQIIQQKITFKDIWLQRRPFPVEYFMFTPASTWTRAKLLASLL